MEGFLLNSFYSSLLMIQKQIVEILVQYYFLPPYVFATVLTNFHVFLFILSMALLDYLLILCLPQQLSALR